MIKLLRGFAYVWGLLLGISVLLGVIGLWWKEGFGKVQEIMSPFNLWNTGVIIVLALPAIGANMLADKLARRRQLKAN
jgi:hypothetical protein